MHESYSMCLANVFRSELQIFIKIIVIRVRDKPVCVNELGDAGGVGHCNMHYMPIHTKLCVKMRITRNRTPQNRYIY